jgi:hypothetical protein
VAQRELNSMNEIATLRASMDIARRLGVDVTGDPEGVATRMRAAVALWRSEVGNDAADAEIASARQTALAELGAKAAADAAAEAAEEAERKRIEQAQRWEAFDGAASVVERHAAALDRALQEAADVRHLLAEACARAIELFPSDRGLVAFLDRRETQRVVERAVLRAGAGDEPESVAAAIRGGLQTLLKVRTTAEVSA